MDRTIEFMQMRDSFGKISTKAYPKSYPIKVFKNPRDAYEEFRAVALGTDESPAAIFCTLEAYEKLQSLKELFGGDTPDEVNAFNKARLDTNPFELIGNSIFINRAAVKLANIDAIFKISG